MERGLTIGDEVKLLEPFPSAQDCEAEGGGGGVGTSFIGGGGGLTMHEVFDIDFGFAPSTIELELTSALNLPHGFIY